MKLLTFLGTGRYDETNYTLGDRSYTTKFAPAASVVFFKPDQMIVFATPEAQSMHGDALRQAVSIPVQFVPIPLGHNTNELWEIFGIVTQWVTEGDKVAFDVTHGLRSFPLLGLLAAAFLRTARQIDLNAVTYGAFDVRDQSVIPNRTPMFDLTPLVSLLEWAAAADRFRRFGDSQDMARLLLDAVAGHPDNKAMENAAESLDKLSQSLRLIRPADAMMISATLPSLLEAARPQAAQVNAAQPYTFLATDLEQAYSAFALSEPFDKDHLQESLGKQRQLVAWYVEHSQWVQAVSLAREWLVSWVMWHLGGSNLLDRELRESIAETMSKEAQRHKAAKDEKRDFTPLLLQQVPGISSVLGTWLSLAGVRNDIDHAGMRLKSKDAIELTKSVKTLCGKLKTLPLDRNLTV